MPTKIRHHLELRPSRMLWTTALVMATINLSLPSDTQAQTPGVEMNDAETAFSERMTDVLLTGRFTVDGQGEAKSETYHIVNVTKTGKDNWLIMARLSYQMADKPAGQESPPLPIPVKIYWANDTPILSLTDLTIPGMGTFTSRVMFFENRYAGTWQHDEKGGHLFGTISKPGAATKGQANADE